MKLAYKILWLDDNIQELFIDDEYVDELNTYLKDHNFLPEIITVSDEKDFFEKLDDTFDLILTDYHLKDKDGATRDGDKIVQQVRERSIYTEILFYSARADLVDTYKLDRISFVETRKMQQKHQEALLISVKKLIDLTIKKFQHIVVMRGMIMNETSTLDSQMLSIIDTFIAQSENDDAVKEIGDFIINQLESHFRSKLKEIEICIKSSNLKRIKKDNFLFSASYKIKTMGQILNHLSLEDFSDDYDNAINKMRNKFAHAVLEKDHETGVETYQIGGLVFDADLCKKIRGDISAQQKNLNMLRDHLIAKKE